MLASKNKARLVLLATFMLGGLTGALINNLLNTAPTRLSHIEEITNKVKLNPQQRQQVEQILDETQKQYVELQKEVRPRFEEIRKEVNPRFEAVRTATRARIRALLPPEQQALYDDYNRERDAQREKRLSERERSGKDSGKDKDKDKK
jgi:hypothetical protein